jgi:glycosyltransferase involved in cell wall biosynthesis
MPNRLSIIIPVYNEMATVATLLNRVVTYPLEGIEKEIIVIESNSMDGSRSVVQKFDAEAKIKAIYENRPEGKGHAVRAGLAAATGDWILIQDADLEYEISDYPTLLNPLKRGEAAFVLGSRHLGHQSWSYRSTSAVGTFMSVFINAGVWVYTQFFNQLYGQRLTDPATMFKVFRRDCLQGLTFHSNGFDLDWEIVAKLVRKGFTPLEFPVTYRSRGFNEGKKVRLWRDGWVSLVAILRYRFGSLSQ